MKKLLYLILLFVFFISGKGIAQSIVSITPDSVMAEYNLTTTQMVEVRIKMRGVALINSPTDHFVSVELNLPGCDQWVSGPPYYRWFATSAGAENDSVILVQVYPNDAVLTSYFDVTVNLQTQSITKDRGFKIQHPHLTNGFTVTPASGKAGQTLDVLISGLHLGGQSSSTTQTSSTLMIDFHQAWSTVVTNFSERLDNDRTVANVTVPLNTAPGCYDVLIRNGLNCQNLNNAFCVTPGTVANPGVIQGKVYNDQSRNCTLESGEPGVPNVVIKATPGPFYAISDTGGNYTLRVPLGNFTIQQVGNRLANPACSPDYHFVTVSTAALPRYDFADTVLLLGDLRIAMHTWNMRPGFNSQTGTWVTNAGNIPMSGTVKIVLDSVQQYVNAFPAPVAHHGDTTLFSFTNLMPGAETFFIIHHRLRPDHTLMGRSFFTYARVNGNHAESNTIDNFTQEHATITNSWDTNDMQVSPEGNLSPADSILTYTIQFQNTGTDTAFTVIIRDTLSPFLDISLIKVLGASHRHSFTLIGQNEAEWRFSNILLPDSNVDVIGSQGFIAYSINLKKGLPVGTRIDNRAGIYFDFNPVVMTDILSNTVADPIKTRKEAVGKEISIYPNPLQKNQSVVRFDAKTDLSGSSFVLRDVMGNTANSSQTIKNNAATLDGSRLTKGLYYYQVQRRGKTLAAGKLAVE